MACEARRELDEMVCRCGKRWDVKDPDPPVCQQDRSTTNFLFASGKPDPFQSLRNDRRFHVAEPPCRASSIAALIPAELSHELAREMTRAYYKHPGDAVYGMRAAYKIFLDSLHK